MDYFIDRLMRCGYKYWEAVGIIEDFVRNHNTEDDIEDFVSDVEAEAYGMAGV